MDCDKVIGRRSRRCNSCNASFYSKGRKWSEERKMRMSKSMWGERNHNFKGSSELPKLIRNLSKYYEWRSTVFEKDDWTCQVCGERGGDKNVHHIKLFSEILKGNNISSIEQAFGCKELWDVNNGKTLCESCHYLTKLGRPAIRDALINLGLMAAS
jgi:hypothetical protein